MTIEIYGMTFSPPCRAVFTVLDYLQLDYDLKVVFPPNGDTRKPEFLKLNPQHTIPVYKEGGFVINESRAIVTYLASKHDKSGKLLPASDHKARATVESRLYFDAGTLMKRVMDIIIPVMYQQQKATEDKFEALKEAVSWLNDFVKPTGYVAGTSYLTVADLALAVSYSCVKEAALVDDLSQFKDLESWFERVKAAVPNYEKANGEGVKGFAGFYREKLAECK